MKQSNFLEKHLVTIIIIFLFGIAIIIGIKQGFNDYQNEKNSLSLLGQTPEKYSLEPEITPTPSRSKRSTEEQTQPKIQTTAARLDQIKTYLFIEPTDTSKLPLDLSKREQEEINKLKNSWKLRFLGYLNQERGVINEKQKECDNHQSHLNSIQPQIEALKPQQQKLEQKKEAKEVKEKEIKDKERQKELASPNDKIRLQTEIEKLEDEVIEIVGEIGKIKVQIKNLETDQKYYQDMLSGDENYKRILEERYKDAELQDKNEILKSLDSLYEIIPNEG
ncbi:hypothetical protein PA0648 [Candidatus Phytoplasma australiense]|uniref:Uncharacterized protein n=1 Tax=Phytoplasma australiense TaxID=59748 RepID=B1VAK9_PHYAS|nr:hypothetical protein PA0648 [Candidatus Phytoplasma australiense]